MIVLDTNVISELWEDSPNIHVERWMSSNDIQQLYISYVTIAELRYGLEIMPQGKRRRAREYLLEKIWLPMFYERILPFDRAAASCYGPIRTTARKNGITIQPADGYIAATVASRGFSIATRDGDFAAAGVPVINPWHGD